jgi:hypothetical protein
MVSHQTVCSDLYHVTLGNVNHIECKLLILTRAGEREGERERERDPTLARAWRRNAGSLARGVLVNVHIA